MVVLEIPGLASHGYEIREKIGEGGYGMVYRAYQPSVERDVAIKVILPELAAKSEFARRFDSEARMVAKLEHPRIVPLYDYWRDDDGAFLVMRYIKGGSLREMMARQGNLSLALIISLFQQIGEALAFAHYAGVVHRDLKPDNILLDNLGNAYLGDFGIAKNLVESSDISFGDAILGTPAYLSPEQIQGQAITPQTDIYSLGIMLYEVVAGEHPFNVGTRALIMKHVLEPIPSIQGKRPGLSEEMDEVLQKATAKKPQERYADVTSFLEAFRESANLSRSTPLTIMPEMRPSTTRKIPATLEGRNRYNMLENVRAFWIVGVLENALRGSTLIDVTLKQREGVVRSPWDTLRPNAAKADATQPPDTSAIDLYDRLKGKMLILGEPGSGKTTMLLRLARDLLHRAENDDFHPIPVVLNLISWAETSKPLTEWIVDELSSKYQAPRQVAKEWVANDSLLLLLDGLDELGGVQRQACVSAVNAYREEHGFVDIVVCSRVHEYEALPNKLMLNGAIIMQPLTDAQIDTYLSGYGAEIATVRAMLKDDALLREMSKSPLMLNIIVLAYRDISSEDLPRLETLEARRKHLFKVYVQRMFERYSGTKSYSDEQTVHYLSWLARKINEQKQGVFLIEKMRPSWLTPDQRNRYYQAVSRFSIVVHGLAWGIPGFLFAEQVYHVSSLISGIFRTMSGAAWGWSVASSSWRRRWDALLVGGVFGILSFITFATSSQMDVGVFQGVVTFIEFVLAYSAFAYFARRMGQSRDNIISVERLRFSREAVRPWMALIGAVIALGLVSQLSSVSAASVAVSVLVGIAIMIGLSGLTSDKVERSVTPNQGIRRSVVNGLFIGLIAAVSTYLLMALPAALSENLAEAAMLATLIALPAFCVIGLFFGLLSAAQHYFLRNILKTDGAIPANYARFLDYAVNLIFLRKVGGGYIFVDRDLQDYFASPEEIILRQEPKGNPTLRL